MRANGIVDGARVDFLLTSRLISGLGVISINQAGQALPRQ